MKSLNIFQFLLIGTIFTLFLLILPELCGCLKWNEIYLGIFSGIFASFAIILFIEIYKKVELNHYLKKYTGIWQGGTINEKRQFAPHNYESGLHYSKASVIYLKDNLLAIKVFEEVNNPNTRIWSGTITIDEKIFSRGSVTFKYTTDLESGYREVLLISDEVYDYIYLYPITNWLYKIKTNKDTKLEIEYKEDVANTIKLKLLNEADVLLPVANYGIEVFRREKIK